MNTKLIQETDYKVDIDSVNRVVCIMSYTSSASGLMASLFDNHPNVLMFPDNVISSFQVFWKENNSLSLDSLIDKFLERYTTIFDARTTPEGLEGSAETGESRGFTTLGLDRNEHLEVNRILFRSYMTEFVGDNHPVSRKLFFQAMHLAYSKALGQKVIDPIIVFGLHNLTFPERYKGLIEDFSDVYFLTMVRDPLRATASRFRRQIKVGVAISHFKKIMSGISRGGVTSSSTTQNRWRAIRMEDLHQSPDETMKNICNWIDLPWSNVLLESTIHGKKWWNEKQSIQVSGFNTAFTSQNFDEYLSQLDRIRLSVLLSRKCASWNYSVPWWSSNIIAKLLVFPLLLIPFRMELMVWSKIIVEILKERTPLAKKVWLCLRTLSGGIVLGRLALINAWLITLVSNPKEVQLL